ncbi:MAG: divalent-cation tolerance protein CutA [Verrucomicrobiales bacterium]|nr:divalent-cation tolerance protein CutA [Verrucomicrobiales bacterium]
MPQDQYLIVYCTLPSIDEARQIGTQLVESQVAACVNLVPQIESIYRWEGKATTSNEVLALIKTTEANYRAVEAAIQRLHPYKVPAIVAVPVAHGSQAYLGWISENTRD